MPMWIRMDGGMLIWTDKPGLTVADGDWSTLVVEVWPCPRALKTSRTIYERSTEENPPSQDVTLSTDGEGTATVDMTKSDIERAWVVRVNLLVGQTVVNASVDGKPVETSLYKPNPHDSGTLGDGYWPFGGEGSVPASKAGNVVELKVPAGTSKRKVEVIISDGKEEGKKSKSKGDVNKEDKKAKSKGDVKKEDKAAKSKGDVEKEDNKSTPKTAAALEHGKKAIMSTRLSSNHGKKAKMESKPASNETAETPPVIVASQLSPETAQRLSQGTSLTAGGTASCLLSMLALAGVAARVVRWRVPDELEQAPAQSPEAAVPLVEQSQQGHVEEA
mmetsp:Transcript_12786/g.34817  ORF Transcript_12786/g.34817 Transcript_12786/m.34817 type:complete len:332 (-) Transcript_12786:515-1510(-)